MHELAHVALHFNQETDLFFDELDKAHPQLNNYLMQLFDGILQRI